MSSSTDTCGHHRRDGVRTFTWRELSHLNEAHNAHIAYRRKVYNVSSFISKHPGGADPLLLAAGRDITQIFESYHNPEVAVVLEKYYVGEMIDSEYPVFPEMGQFYLTLKRRVNKYLKENNLDRKVEFWGLFKYFIVSIIVLSCWSLAIAFHSVTPLCFLFATISGVFMPAFFLALHHDANHYAITHSPLIWNILQLFSESVSGLSSHFWKYEHNIGHHPYTNMKQDPDTLNTDKVAPVWRVIKSHKWIKVHVYQHIYLPFLYSVMVLALRIGDFDHIFTQKRHGGLMRMNPMSWFQLSMFWMGKITFCLHRYILPLVFMPIWNMILMNIFSDVAFSFLLGNLNMISHLSSNVASPPNPDKNNEMNIEWAKLQLITTCDYCTDSWFWTLITGGINHQIAHHLFPDIIQSHYRWLTPLVKRTCAEFGMPYKEEVIFSSAWKTHFNFLKKMGEGK